MPSRTRRAPVKSAVQKKPIAGKSPAVRANEVKAASARPKAKSKPASYRGPR